MAMGNPAKNAKSVAARIQCFDTVADDWVDIAVISSTDGNRIATEQVNVAVGQTQLVVSATSDSTELLAANTARVATTLINTGKIDVWVACDVSAVVDQGQLLVRNGGSMVLDQSVVTKGPLNGITDGGTSQISIQDFNRG